MEQEKLKEFLENEGLTFSFPKLIECGIHSVDQLASLTEEQLQGMDLKLLQMKKMVAFLSRRKVQQAEHERKMAEEVPMTVLEGLVLWLDVSAEETLGVAEGQQVTEWRSRPECPVNRSLVSEFGAPLLTDFGATCKAVEFDYNKSMRILPPMPPIQTIISVHKFKPCSPERAQFYIICGSKQGPFHGDSERISCGHGAWSGAGGKPFFDGTIRLNGTVGAVKETALWTDDFQVATVTCTEPVPLPGGPGVSGLDRIGRDRVYHEFSGYLAEMLVFTRVLEPSEINIVEGYLKGKHAQLPGVG